MMANMQTSLKVAFTMHRFVKCHHQTITVQRLFDNHYINNQSMLRQSDKEAVTT